ncbi:class I SAM-dependent methyltransferase [bacterium]|nr:class I SAM-dependent methyltransferase [bacterium]
METEIKKIQQITSKIDGWLSNEEGELLYNLAKKCNKNGVIVEIGSWKGKSTIWLAKGSQAGKNIPIFAIDHHNGSFDEKTKISTFNAFIKNIKDAKIEDIVHSIVKKSHDASINFKKPINLIFIDGGHDYQTVKQDFNDWFNKLNDGGVMIFHDSTTRKGVWKIVSKKLHKSKYFKNVNFLHSITYGIKTSQNTLADRLKNRFNLYLKSIYINLIKIPVPKFLWNLGKKIIRKIQ